MNDPSPQDLQRGLDVPPPKGKDHARPTDLHSIAFTDHSCGQTTTSFAGNSQFLWFLLSTTIHWAAAGIAFMLAGIITLYFALLPRIYTCPPGATCPHSFNPHGQILRTAQTIMLYWLQVGCLIAGVSLFKLISYQAWFIMKKNGNAIGDLELNLAAIHGHAGRAALLIWRRRNLSVALLVLSQLAIFTVIPFVVNRSISELRPAGRVRATFTYPENFTLSLTEARVPSGVKVQVANNAWVLGDNKSHPFDDFHGTFVFRDNRTLYALSSQPGGSQVSGTVSCSGDGISSTILPRQPEDPFASYNASYGDRWMIVDDTPIIGSSFLGTNVTPTIANDSTTVFFHILWATNTEGVILNGTTTTDGHVHLAHCIHTIDITPIEDKHLEVVQPTRFSLPLEKRQEAGPVCAGDRDDVCLKVYIGYELMVAWSAALERRPSNAPGQSIGSIKLCQRGALTALYEAPDDTCSITTKSWTATLAILVDAVMEASQKNGISTQNLWVVTESISRRQWWLQAVVPGVTFILYILSIASVFYQNRRREVMKELLASEIVMTAVPEQDVQEYARRGDEVDQLRIGGDFGMVRTTHIVAPSLPLIRYPSGFPHGGEKFDREPTYPPSRTRLILPLLRRTGYPVLVGIVFMFAGIVIFRFAVLPRIYTCPDGATCQNSYNPRGPILRVIQTIMLYWLQVGCLISAVGVVKVMSYHGWFVMNRKGETIQILELSLGTVHGSVLKAVSLLLKRHHRSFALLAIFHLVISSTIALVVNRSISTLRTTGEVEVKFAYAQHFALSGVVLPRTDVPIHHPFTQSVANGYVQWLLGSNNTHPFDQFSSTLVIRDGRTKALHTQPGGSRVSGTVFCSSINMSSTVLPPVSLGDTNVTQYNITYSNWWTVFDGLAYLSSAYLRPPFLQFSDGHRTTVVFQLLWMSNTLGAIPGGATTNDGLVRYATCNHTIEFIPIPDTPLDHVQAATLVIPPEARNGSHPMCADGAHDDVCMSLVIAEYFSAMWFGVGKYPLRGQITPFVKRCTRGTWSNFGDPLDRSCRVDTGAWTVTLAALTDGLLRTRALSDNTTQSLWVNAESISRRQWWLQAVIPCSTFALYAVCIGYVVYLSNGQTADLKELSLSEIVIAAASRPKDILEHIGRKESIGLVVVGGKTGSGTVSAGQNAHSDA